MSAFDLCVGIPSRNEASTIRHVVQQIDRGLADYFPGLRAAIVNVDGRSEDGTGRVFFETPTRAERIHLDNRRGGGGKGSNIRIFMEFAAAHCTAAAAMVDADISSIRPEWMRLLLTPVLEGEAEFVVPSYSRHRYDGNLTNHVCFPLVYGVAGAQIRQPIGGDFAFSIPFIVRILALEFDAAANGFGVDILLCTEAIRSGGPVRGAALGLKRHAERSAANLEPMFHDVVRTLFRQLRHFARHEGGRPLDEAAASFGRDSESAPAAHPPVAPDAAFIAAAARSGLTANGALYRWIADELRAPYDSFRCFLNGDTFVDPVTWSRTLLDHVYLTTTNQLGVDDATRSLFPLFCARLHNHLAEIRDLSDEGVERLILEQARNVRALRSRLDWRPR